MMQPAKVSSRSLHYLVTKDSTWLLRGSNASRRILSKATNDAVTNEVCDLVNQGDQWDEIAGLWFAGR
jgi:hypothetical protein